MKFVKKILFITILLLTNITNAQTLTCPQTLTCRYAPDRVKEPGPFYHSPVECIIDKDNKTMWENFKVNDNFTPSTVLTNTEWVTLSFTGGYIPADTEQENILSRPRCLYGIYNPYIPYFVSTMRSSNKKFHPAEKSRWHQIQDQYGKSLLICDNKDASHCGMILE
jgi:hypothetical protein